MWRCGLCVVTTLPIQHSSYKVRWTYYPKLRQRWGNIVILILWHQRRCKIVYWLYDVSTLPQRCHNVVCWLLGYVIHFPVTICIFNYNNTAVAAFRCFSFLSFFSVKFWKQLSARPCCNYDFCCFSGIPWPYLLRVLLIKLTLWVLAFY